jgi:hypothetical protein
MFTLILHLFFILSLSNINVCCRNAHVLYWCFLNHSTKYFLSLGLAGQLREQWMELVAYLVYVRLITSRDMFYWDFTANNFFSVYSMYKGLITNDNIAWHKDIWKAKMPSNINIFMWYLHREITLTKDNLLKCN